MAGTWPFLSKPITLPGKKTPAEAGGIAAAMVETDVMMITFSPDGRYFLGFDSQQLRARLFGERNKLKPSIAVTQRAAVRAAAAKELTSARPTRPSGR